MATTEWRQIPLLGICVALSACETTGDPTKGGLFGWSQHKADERQQDLQQQNATATAGVSSEQQRQLELQGSQAGLTAEAQRLQPQVDRLLTENTQLETQLKNLMGEKQFSEAELRHLNGLLDQNVRLRRWLEQASSQSSSGTGDTRPDAVNSQNQKLHAEILALLGR